MEPTLDPRQPVQQTAGSPEPGLGGDMDGRRVEPGGRQYSFSAECECPDDCPRDHANE